MLELTDIVGKHFEKQFHFRTYAGLHDIVKISQPLKKKILKQTFQNFYRSNIRWINLGLNKQELSNIFDGIPVSNLKRESLKIKINHVSGKNKFIFQPQIAFQNKLPLVEWDKSYNYSDYLREIKQQVENFSNETYSIKFSKANLIIFDIKNFYSSIENEVSHCANIVKELHSKAIANLGLKPYENSLAQYFEFPQNVRVYCEQYLLYFVEFLHDLGVNATSDLKHEIGKVLFSVMPTDDEALDKIREALEIYLRLPSSSLISSQEIEIQRLEAQVEFFRSQIRLARAELQLKAATIQQQQLTIMKLGENVLIDSMIKDVTPNNSETQGEILGGSVKLRTPKKLEDYGIEKIDLKKLWDYLKGKFKKTD